MITAMYNAREAMVPGSIYDRSGQMSNGHSNSTNNNAPNTHNFNGAALQQQQHQAFQRDAFLRSSHDQIGYISAERAHTAGINLPVPVGMFMPPSLPVPFYGQPHPAYAQVIGGMSASEQEVEKQFPVGTTMCPVWRMRGRIWSWNSY